MRVFKFGGASVKDADAVRNIPGIISASNNDKLVVIISAMGKTTNALESIVQAAYDNKEDATLYFRQLYDYHLEICHNLFTDESHNAFGYVNGIFDNIKLWMDSLRKPDRKNNFDFYYDQIVPAGELLSTRILSCFLHDQGLENQWMDARALIRTDDTYRAARVDWQATEQNIRSEVIPQLSQNKIVVSQGFIGGTLNYSTSLGREGSDFSAAIFANILDAKDVVVWKDVPGYLNADPAYFDDTVKLDRISYSESIELAFYGAKIIHPKTIRPLKQKSIPLRVKSFLDPDSEGSVIHEDLRSDGLIPSCIIKEKQVLISISSRDFSFIAEEHLHRIFGIFASHRICINLMQNSAISFSVCIDDSERLEGLINELLSSFSVKYNRGLRLITIRHYDTNIIDKLTKGKEVLLEQRSRVTVQMVVK